MVSPETADGEIGLGNPIELELEEELAVSLELGILETFFFDFRIFANFANILLVAAFAST